MEKKRLTIVIPVYNAEAHVERMDGLSGGADLPGF